MIRAMERIMARKEISVKKYVVRLSGEERQQLETLIRKGKGPARRLLKARILLKADVSDVDRWKSEPRREIDDLLSRGADVGDESRGRSRRPPAMRSSATRNGPVALPRLSRINSRRITSSGTPCCRAMLASTAVSCALVPAMLPALWFRRKISATLPSSKRDTVAVNLRPCASMLEVSVG